MDPQTSVSIYYLSSGRLGIPILDALVDDARIRLLGVGSQPDRPSGRKRRLEPTALARYGLERGIAVERIENVNDEAWLAGLARRSPELVVVASFGQILRPALLNMPASGCLNVHASLLPRHRGASPIAAAILAGDARTGICFMAMDEGLDTGPVYSRVHTEIGPRETAEELETRLGRLAARHVVDVIWAVAREGIEPEPQPDEGVTYAPRLRKKDGELRWDEAAADLARRVRAMIPWPRAFTFLPTTKGRRRLQIVEAVPEKFNGAGAFPGEVLAAGTDGLVVACGEGQLRLLSVIPEGRSRMSVSDFLRGNSLDVGTRLGGNGDGSETK